MELVFNNNNYDFFIYLTYIITLSSLLFLFIFTYLKYLISKKLYSAILDAKRNWQKRFATSKLNKWLEIKTSEYPPPMLKGRRLRLRYITQIKSRPPNFLIFSSSLDVPKNYRRFLLNNIREQFNLKNIPIRLKFKVGNNPYV